MALRAETRGLEPEDMRGDAIHMGKGEPPRVFCPDWDPGVMRCEIQIEIMAANAFITLSYTEFVAPGTAPMIGSCHMSLCTVGRVSR